ncbi:TPA: hypothetical protein OND39_004501 [Enterobacter asburiae]|nr:hypothetical protein [Enterobacter asburiae]
MQSNQPEDAIQKVPGMFAAYSTLLSIVAILSAGMISGVDIKILLLLALAITVMISVIDGWSFTLLMEKMCSDIVRAFPALCIFILIGALTGSWIQAGIIQTLIFYGLQILSPAFFLPAGLLVCSVVSLTTGTSWGTRWYHWRRIYGNRASSGYTGSSDCRDGRLRCLFW